jgi:hypothetical protein
VGGKEDRARAADRVIGRPVRAWRSVGRLPRAVIFRAFSTFKLALRHLQSAIADAPQLRIELNRVHD